MFQSLESILLGFWAGFLSWAYKLTVIMGVAKILILAQKVTYWIVLVNG
jgi:hypothetical protein